MNRIRSLLRLPSTHDICTYYTRIFFSLILSSVPVMFRRFSAIFDVVLHPYVWTEQRTVLVIACEKCWVGSGKMTPHHHFLSAVYRL